MQSSHIDGSFPVLAKIGFAATQLRLDRAARKRLLGVGWAQAAIRDQRDANTPSQTMGSLKGMDRAD
jgi:hypothetical protein